MSKNKVNMNNKGLLHSLIDTTHWLAENARGRIVLQDDGQWDDFLPSEDIQNRYGFDPYSCTSYGTINAIEILMRKMGVNADYSERYLAIASNTRPPGNDPHVVCETVRKMGLVSEAYLPCDDAKTLEEYYYPVPLTALLLTRGEQWLQSARFLHWWVFDRGDSVQAKVQKLRKALAYSPVCVSVFAWTFRNGIAVKPQGAVDGHWCVVYGWNDDGTWKCLDSLDYSRKTLSADYDFDMAKSFSVLPTSKPTFLSRVADIIRALCRGVR